MKKLMIAAAIVCAAVTSQAANLNWTSLAYHNDGNLDDDWFTGGQGYLILVTDAANFAVADDLTITGGTLLTGDGSRNVYNGGVVEGAIDGSAFGAEHGEDYLFAILATDKGTAKEIPTTGLYGVDDNNGDFFSVTWNKDNGGSFYNELAAAAVTTAVAPEPTSGLLLLLGVAGLALRRRRA